MGGPGDPKEVQGRGLWGGGVFIWDCKWGDHPPIEVVGQII